MDMNELLLKLNAEQLLSRVIRYNNLVNINAPEIVRASEGTLIQLKYISNRGLISRTEEINRVVEDEKEEEELGHLYCIKGLQI